MNREYNKKYVVSSCLAGIKCRYDKTDKKNDYVCSLVKSGQAIPMCPECLGGLSIPRKPSEIINKDGKIRVVTIDGEDVTTNYEMGANKVLKYCIDNNIKHAILMDKSPSCGLRTYDGTFSGKLVNQNGITAKKLLDNGIEVISSDSLKG